MNHIVIATTANIEIIICDNNEYPTGGKYLYINPPLHYNYYSCVTVVNICCYEQRSSVLQPLPRFEHQRLIISVLIAL